MPRRWKLETVVLRRVARLESSCHSISQDLGKYGLKTHKALILVCVWEYKSAMVASFTCFHVFLGMGKFGPAQTVELMVRSQISDVYRTCFVDGQMPWILPVQPPVIWKLMSRYIMGNHGHSTPKKCLPPQAPSFLIIMGSEMLRVFKGPKLETTAGPFSLKTSATAGATVIVMTRCISYVNLTVPSICMSITTC